MFSNERICAGPAGEGAAFPNIRRRTALAICDRGKRCPGACSSRVPGDASPALEAPRLVAFGILFFPGPGLEKKY